MEKPVILLAYADSDLQNVIREIGEIEASLKTKKEIEVEVIADADAEKIFEQFIEYGDRIVAFHFAGHSNGKQLNFAGGHAGYAGGLAELMGQSKNLEFVFLNGCANKDQVTLLQQAGISVVIATSADINDSLAADFAPQFYTALVAGWTAGRAFDTAKSFINTKQDGKFTGDARHFSTDTPQTTSAFPWGIYYHADGPDPSGLIKSFEDWTLPQKIDYVPIPPKYSPNRDLILVIATKALMMLEEYEKGGGTAEQARKEKNVEMLALFDLRDKFDAQPKKSALNAELGEAVINLIPRPLGVLLRRMIAQELDPTDPDSCFALLKLQVWLYDTLVKLCAYFMLSSLYGLIAEKGTATVTPGQLEEIKRFFSINALTKDDFDYTAFIITIREILEKSGSEPFIKEHAILKDSFKNKDSFYRSHMFLQGLKYRLTKGKVHPLSAPGLCSQTETELCNIFEKVFFIIKYKLLVIKNIEAIKYRDPYTAIYEHKRILLHKASYAMLIEDELEYTNLADCYSVIVTRDIRDMREYLSLSPFVIDKNVLTDSKNSMLYFFSHMDNLTCVFECVEDTSLTIKLNDKFDPSVLKLPQDVDETKVDKRFKEILRQLTTFKDKVTNLQPV